MKYTSELKKLILQKQIELKNTSVLKRSGIIEQIKYLRMLHHYELLPPDCKLALMVYLEKSMCYSDNDKEIVENWLLKQEKELI